jgi:hypothetical protein
MDEKCDYLLIISPSFLGGRTAVEKANESVNEENLFSVAFNATHHTRAAKN